MNLLAYIGNNVGRALESRFFSQAKILGVPRIIGYALGVNCNSASTDNAVILFLMPNTNFTVTKVQVNNASVSMTTATASVYTAAAAGGSALAADQALSALTVTSTGNMNMTLASAASNAVLNAGTLATANTLYIRIGSAQGAAATADFYIWGECLP